jgi:hypothetical protein
LEGSGGFAGVAGVAYMACEERNVFDDKEEQKWSIANQ